MMQKSVKAAIFVEQRKPLVIAEVQLPQHLDVGQVLVRMLVSGICGSQIGEIDGAKGSDPYLPHLLGHEGCGIVKAVGPGVRRVAVGDKVVLHWRKAPGIDAVLPAYSWEGRKVNAGSVTTFNEYGVISENRLTVVPPDTDPEIAALFGCAVTTGLGVVVNNAKIGIGESVAVFGAGGVGLNIVQGAAMVSAWPVIAVDLHDARLELAASLGATHIINGGKVDAAVAIKEIVGDASLDVFVDNTGLPSVIEMGYGLVKPQGRVTLVGVPRKGSNSSIYTLPLHFGKILSGSHGGEAQPERDIPRYLHLFKAGRLELQRLITERFPLDRINDAITAMRDGRTAGRCMIIFDSDGR